MKLAASTKDYIVYDEVFEKQEFEALYANIQTLSYERLNQTDWISVYRNLDGSPLESHKFSSQCREDISAIYRTFVKRIEFIALNAENVIGKFSTDWDFFTGKTSLYPQNTRLSWHQDGIKRSGAYTFYAHPQWNIQWGGELLIASKINNDTSVYREWESRTRKLQHFDNSLLNQIISEIGIGHYIYPRPNRLVLLSNQVLHSINRVDPSIGDGFRIAINGFFGNSHERHTQRLS